MTTRTILLIVLGLGIIALLYVTLVDGQSGIDTPIDPVRYKQELMDERAKKDQNFRTGSDSPITNKAQFSGLTYFAPDPAYRVTARLEPFADKTQKLVVRMSDGSEEVYEKFAHAVFQLQGETSRLLIVKADGEYTVLFQDATSGKETYGGGRYLELDSKQMSDTQVVLDFNAAYNPYCAYNPGYACPLPPPKTNYR
ncbi:DUF1684 domain-containing protein [Spirosoma rhododendri]|uniref:DUF1684 domain-containing protein n=1 Tax=Spirosoma rhododendri TaxID=2728024 RepID=UPI002FCDAE54